MLLNIFSCTCTFVCNNVSLNDVGRCILHPPLPTPANLASTQRTHLSTEGELSQAQRQCGLLQAQVDSLTVQLGSRESELEATLLAHHQSRESSAQQSREEVTALRTKVRGSYDSSPGYSTTHK